VANALRTVAVGLIEHKERTLAQMTGRCAVSKTALTAYVNGAARQFR